MFPPPSRCLWVWLGAAIAPKLWWTATLLIFACNSCHADSCNCNLKAWLLQGISWEGKLALNETTHFLRGIYPFNDINLYLNNCIVYRCVEVLVLKPSVSRDHISIEVPPYVSPGVISFLSRSPVPCHREVRSVTAFSREFSPVVPCLDCQVR